MRILEHRRHSFRQQNGHLSREGVDLARRVGKTAGPFDFAVTSPVTRAVETAIAMGYAVDDEIDLLATFGPKVEAEVDWREGFQGFSRALPRNGAATAYMRDLADLMTRLVTTVAGGGRVLVISHGGVVEASAVGCLPDADHEAWGPACEPCEGVRMTYDGDAFTSIEILRLS
jgi:broad specificity phosphatase PhoE